MVRTVFKIAEAVARRLVGSIPTRSRQNQFDPQQPAKIGSSAFISARCAEMMVASFEPYVPGRTVPMPSLHNVPV